MTGKRRRPAYIQVGPLRWTVVWEGHEDGSYGSCDTYTLTINIRDDLAPDLERETVMHELLHAVYRTAGIDSTVMREEQIVSALSPHLMDAMLRTPGLLSYLFPVAARRP